MTSSTFDDILAELSAKLVDFARELIKPHRIIHYLWYTAWPDGQNRYEATELYTLSQRGSARNSAAPINASPSAVGQ
jgi:hypothetical protein